MVLVLIVATSGPARRAVASPPPAAPVAKSAVVELEERIRAIAGRVGPAVVHIASRAPAPLTTGSSRPDLPGSVRHFFGPAPEPPYEGMGSGVVVDPSGIILTNAHVVDMASEIRVRFSDGRQGAARVLGVSDLIDLAVLDVEGEGLPHAPIGVAGDLKVGALVLAFGSPFGFDHSMTFGVVSALRDQEDGPIPSRMIQTDAAINPGSSGGPLIDMAGAVVGINTSIYSRSGGYQGIGFALPIDEVEREMNAILERPGPRLPWLGTVVVAVPGGLEVATLIPGSPAAGAGLEPGDLMVRIGDASLDQAKDLGREMIRRRPGDRIRIAIRRGGRPREVTLALAPRPLSPGGSGSEPEPEPPGPSGSDGGEPGGAISASLTDDLASRGPGSPAAGNPASGGSLRGARSERLSEEEGRALEEVLADRDCPCPCMQTLRECFGCSVAKDEVTAAIGGLRRGRSPASVRRILDAPVRLVVWGDLGDEESRRTYRACLDLEASRPDVVRAVWRHLPVGEDAPWRRLATLYEGARELGRFEDFREALLARESPVDAVAALAMLERMGVERAWLERAMETDRYRDQLRKDLDASREEYDILDEEIPALFIADELFEGDAQPAGLGAAVDRQLRRIAH